MDEYKEYVENNILIMRNVLLKKNRDLYVVKKDWLMGEITSALMLQDEKIIMILRGHLADLIPLAREHGDAGEGERWQTIWEILHAFHVTSRPLEQLRLASSKLITGVLMRVIENNPGLSGVELSNLMDKSLKKVNDSIASLERHDLIMHIPSKGLFLTATGREMLLT